MHIRTVVIGMVLLFASFLVPLASQLTSGAEQTWIGDQLIDAPLTVTGDTINLTGNLTITSSGSLTLSGATLKVNSNATIRYHIEVQTGGTLKILSSSTVQSFTTSYRYLFWVRPGATLQIDHSTIRDCGYQATSPTDRGLYIQSNLASVTNSTLTNNFAGFVADNGSSPFIYQNDILSNDWAGACALNGSRPVVDHNTISRNLRAIGAITPVGAVYSSEASPFITNNTLDANVVASGTYTIGIFLSGAGYPNITDNKITNHAPTTSGGWVGGLYTEIGSPYIARNTLSKNSNGFNLYNGSAVVEDNLVESSTQTSRGWGLVDLSGSILRNNVYSKNNYGVLIADNGHSSFERETIKDSVLAGIGGDGASAPFSGTFINCTLSGNAKDLHLGAPLGGTSGGTCVLVNTTFNNATSNLTDPNMLLIIKWFVHVKTVIQSTGAIAAGATVKCLDKKGGVQLQMLTDQDGWTGWMVLQEKSRGTSDEKNVTLSPYNITGLKNGISNYSIIDLNRNYEFTLPLDDIPPWIKVDYPADGAVINRTSVNLTGTVEPGTWVSVNGGKGVVDADGNWYSVVPLPIEGRNMLDVSVVDKGRNRVDTFLNVTRDTTAPMITLTTPSDNFLVNMTPMDLSGTTTDPGGKVFVNGIQVPIDANGSFSTKVELLEGPNTVTIIGWDAAGNSYSNTLRGELDSAAPGLVVLQPTNNFATNGSTVTVKGYTDPDCTVTVNDRTAAMSGANFTLTANLLEGPNGILVNSTDRAGNVRTVVVKVLRDSTPPAITITSPAMNSAVNQSLIEVTGTVEEGSTVRVNGAGATVIGRTFTAQVRLDIEGKNAIRIEALDALKNRNTTELIVYFDTTPPDIKISIPADNFLTNQLTTDVKGRTEPKATVTVNDEPVEVDANGLFSIKVSLDAEGPNSILISVTDGAGNVAETTLTVIRDTMVKYTISNPRDNQTTKWKNLTVSGNTEPGSTVTIQGSSVSVGADGMFSAEVFLAEGTNTISIIIRDKAGNTQSVSLTVKKVKGSTPPAGFIPGFEGLAAASVVGLLLIVLKRRGHDRA